MRLCENYPSLVVWSRSLSPYQHSELFEALPLSISCCECVIFHAQIGDNLTVVFLTRLLANTKSPASDLPLTQPAPFLEIF